MKGLPAIGGFERIAATVAAVDYVVSFATLANVNAAMRVGLLDVLEAEALCALAKAPHWTMRMPRHSLPSCISRYSTYGSSGTPALTWNADPHHPTGHPQNATHKRPGGFFIVVVMYSTARGKCMC